MLDLRKTNYMDLENQVSSLEPSEKLKELGVKQESNFYWWKINSVYELCIKIGDRIKTLDDLCYTTLGHKTEEYVSAFTVAELGEMLPGEIKIKGNAFLSFEKQEDNWLYLYEHIYGEAPYEHIGISEAKTEVDARAKMLIYLIENKQIIYEHK